MMAAQLLATHNATRECYRRAMIAEQTLEGRREKLNQANKLSRTYATLIEALNRHRGKGQQKVTVEHVHVHAGGQAVVGIRDPRGRGRTNQFSPRSPATGAMVTTFFIVAPHLEQGWSVSSLRVLRSVAMTRAPLTIGLFSSVLPTSDQRFICILVRWSDPIRARRQVMLTPSALC